MQIAPIPEFLKDYLYFTSTHTVTDPADLNYTFCLKPNINEVKDNFAQHQYIVGFYQIMKGMLNVMIYNNEERNKLNKSPIAYSVANERDIYDFPYKRDDVAVLRMVLDIPMYWYNPETEELGMSIIPGGLFFDYSNNIN